MMILRSFILSIFLIFTLCGGTWFFIPSLGIEPDDLSGLKIWFRADEANVTKDGADLVSQWDDTSGNAKHATQATAAKQPLWVDNQINGYPIIRFDEDAMTFDSTYDIYVLNTSTDLWVVLKVNQNSTERYMFVMGEDAGGGHAFAQFSNTSWIARFYTPGGTLWAKQQYTFTWGTTNFHYMYHNYDGGTGTDINSYSAEGDGVSLSQSAAAGSSFTTENILGNWRDVSESTGIQGDIAEIIVYRPELSAADRNKLNAYLTNRYNL